MGIVKESFSEIINGDKPVLVDFYAEWCGPCKYMAPILKDVAKETEGKARILKIDVDRNQALSAQFQIQSVPTLIIFSKGKPVWRTSGVMPASELVSMLNTHAAL